MQATCSHLDQIADVGPGADVCETCVQTGATWVTLRQCRTCGRTGCCDSSPNKHASAHFQETSHPIMRSVERGHDWSWCFVDEQTLRQDETGAWQVVDAFFDAGLWFARQALDDGASPPFAAGTTAAGSGFPLAVWEATYRGKHARGTLDPDLAAGLEALPGWRW